MLKYILRALLSSKDFEQGGSFKRRRPLLLNWVHLSSPPEELQNPENAISVNVELYNRRTYHATIPDNFVISSQFLTILLFTLSHQEINEHVQRDNDIQTAYAYDSAKAYSQRPSACSDLSTTKRMDYFSFFLLDTRRKMSFTSKERYESTLTGGAATSDHKSVSYS